MILAILQTLKAKEGVNKAVESGPAATITYDAPAVFAAWYSSLITFAVLLLTR